MVCIHIQYIPIWVIGLSLQTLKLLFLYDSHRVQLAQLGDKIIHCRRKRKESVTNKGFGSSLFRLDASASVEVFEDLSIFLWGLSQGWFRNDTPFSMQWWPQVKNVPLIHKPCIVSVPAPEWLRTLNPIPTNIHPILCKAERSKGWSKRQLPAEYMKSHDRYPD